ncbi:hypothetical protein A2917_01065 [Candidatus Nomurabacteria bacterium RIFCSPLOWO2_01_FULL_42_17]|uniref:RNA polymerase sigma-70 domain-containing protein n=1 Tax=Candidatus Nomurabacteria bacterium RIFCSPLOWO2_01_FULL_42_17 TaxID=1801780 RepID=A0A1F6XM82_9BACT|nr:MAG: hypothetical protein A2917_01065 [Candidatus Nomurabacteria bacterium RIFCSPLOWO2_01_FULL_42_17]
MENLNHHALEDAVEADEKTALHLYLRDMGQFDRLSMKQEQELFRRMKKGDKKAREALINSNLRFVVKIASHYTDMGLPLLDLISEGNTGLMKAVERFSEKKRCRLSTYAVWWIKQKIKRALTWLPRTIRIPGDAMERFKSVNGITKKLYVKFEEEPTDKQIGKAMGMSEKLVRRWRDAVKQPISLHAPIGRNGDGKESHLFEIIPDEKALSPSEEFEERAEKEELVEILRKALSERELSIVRWHFGIESEQKTMKQIAKHFGVSRQCVCKIEKQIFSKLRNRLKERRFIMR